MWHRSVIKRKRKVLEYSESNHVAVKKIFQLFRSSLIVKLSTMLWLLKRCKSFPDRSSSQTTPRWVVAVKQSIRSPFLHFLTTVAKFVVSWCTSQMVSMSLGIFSRPSKLYRNIFKWRLSANLSISMDL